MYPGRTTPTLVTGIIDVVAGVDLSPYINSANELVTEKCIDLSVPPAFIYSDARLELIERWLAAHFYTVNDPRAASEGAGPANETLQGRTDMGLNASIYGQMAMRLDTAGGLAIMENSMKKYSKVPAAILSGITIGMSWLGTRFRSHNTEW